MSALFPGTREHRASAKGVEIFVRIGGKGLLLLLLDGFPQTHAMWHRVAPRLTEHFTCVMADLRGCGYSSCPENDMIALMAGLGHPAFAVAGHDRGARVACRMALDRPAAINCLTVLDIVPTCAMWHNFTVKLAMKTYHRLFLAQPNPLPEMLIERAPVAYLWTMARDLAAFDGAELAECRLHYATPEHVHATCNDYRASQTCDLAADEADHAAGKKVTCPTLDLLLPFLAKHAH